MRPTDEEALAETEIPGIELAFANSYVLLNNTDLPAPG